MNNDILQGDVITRLRDLPAESVHTCITSPPYWGLRDYGLPPSDWPAVTFTPAAGLPELTIPAMSCCLGLEPEPWSFVGHMVMVFREVGRVLRGDGTCWVNLGDSYASDTKWGGSTGGKHANGLHGNSGIGRQKNYSGIPDKNLIGIPWMVAKALQADGWWLRSDVIWCLSGGVEVYARTQKGEMPMTIKDMVRLDPATVQLWNGEKWTQVLGWSESPNRGKPIEIELRSGEKIGCTPGHQWPTQRGLLRADELEVGDIIQSCRLPQPTPSDQPEFIPDDIGWLIGLYLAEGSKGKDDTVIQIASHVKEQDRFIRLCEIARAYGATCRMHKTSRNGATINLYGAAIIGVIDQYVSGKTSHDKCLSSACWRRSDAFLREVLSGYLDGDGHYDKKNDRWRLGFTRNYKLASNLRTICARLDVSIRLKLSTATNQNNTFKAFRGEIRFNRGDHHNNRQDTEIIRIGRSNARKFWDIGVVDDPHLFALASGILTHNSKPNPMPESVQDRPTKSHEYLFLLAKSQRYFYDAEAVREANSEKTQWTYPQPDKAARLGQTTNGTGASSLRTENPAGRNRRTVWTIATQPYAGAHFATFPPALVEPCILAGTSARGVCPACGAPWERVVEIVGYDRQRWAPSEDQYHTQAKGKHGKTSSFTTGDVAIKNTTGWLPTCACNAGDPVPATVLDPFFGSGTTGAVAVECGRRYVGIELNPEYVNLAEKRLAGAQPALIPKGLE